jgi:hypothetical protein
MKCAKKGEPVENCCPDDTVFLALHCSKWLKDQRKWPESAVSDASRPSEKVTRNR